MSELSQAPEVRGVIVGGLSACGALLANAPSPDRMDAKYSQMWEWALEGLPPGEIAEAFKEHIKSERFFPTPSDIRRRVDEAQNRREYIALQKERAAREAELREAREAAEAERKAKDKAWKALPPEEKGRLLGQVVREVRERWREKFGNDGPAQLMESVLVEEDAFIEDPAKIRAEQLGRLGR